MDDSLRVFLEKFAELERRVRKLGVEDRALREEVRSLSERLKAMEAEAQSLREMLSEERATRQDARDRLSGLIERLEELQGSSRAKMAQAVAEVREGER